MHLIQNYAWIIIDKQYDSLAVGREIGRIELGYTVQFNIYSLRLFSKLILSNDIKIELNNLVDCLEDRSNVSLVICNIHFYTMDDQVHRCTHW